MKALVVLLVLLFGVWLWRRGRTLPPPQRPKAGPVQTLPMVRCARCGVHVPSDDVIVGRAGSYCTLAHRRESEGA